MIHLGPGSSLPAWLEALEKAAFGSAWGALEDHEQIWLIEGKAYARWSLVAPIGEAELLRIAVAPEARSQGLGRNLLRGSLEALRTLGVTHCRLEVRFSNAPARSLYESEGWQFQGIRKGYYRDGEDAALYGKILSPIR